jgi:hypothetical protein
MYAIKHLQAGSGTWHWGVGFCRGGKRYHQRFYEPKHGGTAPAKRAAIAWRNERLAEIKALTLIEFCQRKRNNNTSGVPGVHFLIPAAQPEGVWQARLKLGDGMNVTKTFSVRKHGELKAFNPAVAARCAMLEAAEDRLFLYDPLAKRLAALRIGVS